MNLFKLSFILNRIPLKSALKEYKKRLSVIEENYLAFGEKRKWEIYNLHKENNPFYKNFLENKNFNNWEEIPILTKKHYQNSKFNFINSDISKSELIYGKTSGSSGVPLIYAKDKFSHALLWAKIFIDYSSFGIKYGQSKQARFYGIPLEGLSYYKELLKDLLLNRDRFIVYDLSEAALSVFLQKFKVKKYEYIYGYTNSLITFAKYLKKNKIILKRECPTLKLCIVTSEVCTSSDRILLGEVFGVRIINEYGSSEVGIIALDNNNEEWVLSDSLLFIEFINENGVSVKNGERGKIVITVLDNIAMPIIRYEVGDWGVLSEQTKIGKRILKQLDGRLNDELILPNGKLVPGFTLYYATKALMDSLPGMREYNIQQFQLNHLHFNLVIDDKSSINKEILKKDLVQITKKYLGIELIITFELVDKLDKSISGKSKHFISHIQNSNTL